VDYSWLVPDLWLTGDHFVGKLSTMGQPNVSAPAIRPSSVGEWVVICVFTS